MSEHRKPSKYPSEYGRRSQLIDSWVNIAALLVKIISIGGGVAIAVRFIEHLIH